MSAPVVVLAGGTGGAKLARGMLEVAGDDLVVVANTGDDIEIHGGHVSPDPDLCTFWLADRIDARGWGIDGDTFAVMDELRALGDDVWFSLGDRDLAVCLHRARRLADGARLTEVTEGLARALGVTARVLPMCDDPVRTRVRASGVWHSFQDYMIREGGSRPGDDLPPVEGVAYEGADAAAVTREVAEAVRDAEVVVIGPSNPAISILPILAVPGMRDLLASSAAPVVAVSPLVGGVAVKGPTERFLVWAGLSRDAAGIAECYDGLIDGIVTDEDIPLDLPVLRTDTLMSDAGARERLARETLGFAKGLA